jgi:hypothetical protein
MKKNALTITVLTLALVFCLVSASFCADEGWVPLFDGKTLDGWKVNGGTASYKVDDGVIVGTTVEGSPNTFLCKGEYKDFVLEFDVNCDPRLNSGVQVRSHVYDKEDADPANRKRAGVVYGPQCEIARKETQTAGRFYDEGRRGKWLAEIRPEARDAFRDDGWNRYLERLEPQRDSGRENGPWLESPCSCFCASATEAGRHRIDNESPRGSLHIHAWKAASRERLSAQG